VLVTGKIYYDLIKERESRGLTDHVAFIRIEELSPFPFFDLIKVLQQYPRTKEYIWMQEEPRNQGGYSHVHSRIQKVLLAMGSQEELRYIGRESDAVPVTGIGRVYGKEQRSIIDAAFDGLKVA
jgi:probable 2-oxoglutarate dehydrogenase E1 component DHKTD1